MKHVLGLVVALFVGSVVYAQEQPSFESWVELLLFAIQSERSRRRQIVQWRWW